LDPLKISFLVLLGLTAVLFGIRFGIPFTLRDIGIMLLDVILVPVALATAAVFMMIIFQINPEALLLQLITAVSNRTVSFVTAVPANLAETLEAKIVQRHDTDADGFEEWVVFYEFDVKSSANPVQLTIYDSDRGVPPVIFPYNLITPEGNYLGEDATTIEFSLVDIIDNPSDSGTQYKEIMVRGNPGRLSLFAYNPAYDVEIPLSQLPANTPIRYQSIGFFRGSGGVKLDATSSKKAVTVQVPYQEARSQLSWRSIYELNPDTNYTSYYQSNCDQSLIESCALESPVLETVDFYGGIPNDILSSRYPENIVLGFYAATCGRADSSLCKNATNESKLNFKNFLHPEGDAVANQASYFGLRSLNNSSDIRVTALKPVFQGNLGTTNTGIDDDPDAPQVQVVSISLTENGLPTIPETLQFELRRDDGQWKIFRTVDSVPALSEAN
jgi:hypothetical protein